MKANNDKNIVHKNNVKRWTKQVEEAKLRLRASILWFLGKGDWVHEVHLPVGSCYVTEEEGMAQYELARAEDKRLSEIEWLVEACYGVGMDQISEAVIESLIQEGLIEAQGTAPHRRLRRIAIDRGSRLRVRKMDEAWKAGVKRANQCLASGVSRPREQIETELASIIGAKTQGAEGYMVLELLMQSYDAAAMKASRPAPSVRNAPSVSQTQRISNRSSATPSAIRKSDPLFWIKAGMFHKSRMWHRYQDSANEPTQWIAKAVVVESLRTYEQPFISNAYELQKSFESLLSPSMQNSLFRRLYDWAMEKGLRLGFQGERVPERSLWWSWMAPRIDWSWVAERLQQEYEKHGDRRENRALELATELCFEHIEYWLDGSVGTIEETIERLSATKRLNLATDDRGSEP